MSNGTGRDFDRVWLIQRLKKAHQDNGSPLSALREAIAFGGGFLHGGFTKESWDILRKIFSFDYMGAAEFEFGDVPRAIEFISKNRKKYTGFSTEVKTKKGAKAMSYIICDKDHKTDVANWIKKKTHDEYSETCRTKEAVNISDAIDLERDWYKDLRGWLEIDNKFLFFIDEEMYKTVAKLLGVKEE